MSSLADPHVLGPWLDSQRLEPGLPMTVTPLPGGRSNVMFRIERGAGHWVLRRPAAVAVEQADAGMLETDPAYQADLGWADQFVREEAGPLRRPDRLPLLS